MRQFTALFPLLEKGKLPPFQRTVGWYKDGEACPGSQQNQSRQTWEHGLMSIETKQVLVALTGAMVLMTPQLDLQASEVAANIDEVPIISVTERVYINPNSTEPEATQKTQALSADGGEFLRQLNGVSASRFGGRGLEPVIRGQSQTRLNILLDGAYVHGGCPNRMDPPASWAALETYEAVTVLKGVQSLIYGGGGSGGTVLFERDTRSLAEKKGVHGRVGLAGSDNGVSYDLSADIVAAGEQGYGRLFGEIKQADNYEDGNDQSVRSSYDHQQGGIVLGWTPSDNSLLELTYEHNDFSDALYPGAGMDSPEETGDFYRLRFINDFDQGWLTQVKVEAYLSDVDHLMDNYSLRTPPNYPPMMMNAGSPMKRATPTESKTIGGRLVLESLLADTTLQYGLDLQSNTRDGVLGNRDSNMMTMDLSYMWPDATIAQQGVFAEATTPLSTQADLTYGLRVDRVDFSVDKADATPMMMSPNGAYQQYYGVKAVDDEAYHVGALLRYTRKLSPGLQLFTGISRSVRAADATERYMNKWHMNPAQRWIGNPDIAPEKHHQIDLGVSKTEASYGLSGALYYDQVSDYILRDTARGQTGILLSDNADIYRNVDAVLQGVELDGWLKVSSELAVSGHLAYVHATNTSDERPMAQTPPLNGKVQLDYDWTNWGAGSRVRFAAEQNRIDLLSKQEVGATPGWAVLDLYGHYQINPMLTLRLGVDNLLDQTYAEHISRANLLDTTALQVNEPGRVIWAKLGATF